MFEQPKIKPSISPWKIVPVVTLGLALLVALAFVLMPEPHPQVQDQIEGVLRAENATYQWYQQYLKLDETKVSLATNFTGNRAVIFSGVVHNLGEKTLDAVELKLTLFNADRPVWETVRTPLRPGSEPLKSLQSRRLSLYIEDLPDDWRSTNAEIEIHGFRFQERPISAAR